MRSRSASAVPDDLAAWVDAAAWPVETIAYGSGPDHVADLRLPRGDDPHRTAIVIHGGFWRAPYRREWSEAIAVAVAQAGWATWNLEYRRVGAGGGYPATLEDVAAGADAVRAHSGQRPVAIGHSAGGHLALWLASTGRVAAAVSLAGVCDLAAAARDGLGSGAAAEFAGGDPEAYRAADPATLLPYGVPQVLVHGTEDDRVPIAQSRGHLERARAAGDACELVELEGADHFDVIDPRSRFWPRIRDAIMSA